MTRADFRVVELATRADLDAFARDFMRFWIGTLAVQAVVIVGIFYLAIHYAR